MIHSEASEPLNLPGDQDDATRLAGEDINEEFNPELAEGNDAKPKIKFWEIAREILETVVLALVIWLAINYATARYVVVGSSMQPTLESGQYLIVSRMEYRLGEPERGDVVVFDYPGSPTDDYVKRVIGLPGETVRVANGHVFINDMQLDETYLQETTPGQGEWVVPTDSYFVLGDNRNGSSDSRSWGTLEGDYIIGRAWVSYWPPEAWGIIRHHEFGTP